MRSLGGFFALALLGMFGVRAVALPIHDSQHFSFHQARAGKDAPAAVSARCDLCLEHATGAAAVPGTSVPEAACLPDFSGRVAPFSDFSSSAFHLRVEARGPPLAA
jgi:hypothetical protein